MNDLILHHYASSPFSEKVRLILGFKGLAWRGVTVPVVLPKPDAVALTGGYRRTPFLQVGADVYCDSALIADVLEVRAPSPTLYPASAPLARALAHWIDSTVFWTMIPHVMQPAGLQAIFGGLPQQAMQAFAADRAAFTAGMSRKSPADAGAQLATYLAWFEAQLGHGGRWLLGDEPSIADFALAHNVWFIRRAPPVAGVLDAHPRLAAWHERVAAFGHATSSAIDADEALRLAAAAKSHAPCEVEAGLGFDAGQPVVVAATDYGRDPVAGRLVGLTRTEVVVERDDPRAGTLHVHFPRIGFMVKKEDPS